jgi:DNA-binding response OmpR family regulator
MSVRPRVLIVEDNQPLAENMVEVLECHGVDAFVAADVDEALRIVDAGFAGIITDLRLPGRSGVDLIRELRGRGLGVPIAVVTALADSEARRAIANLEGSAMGAKVFEKPMRFDALASWVEEIRYPCTEP